jgi:hypothetical protein
MDRAAQESTRSSTVRSVGSPWRGQHELDRQVEQRTDASEGRFVLSIADVVWTRTGFGST